MYHRLGGGLRFASKTCVGGLRVNGGLRGLRVNGGLRGLRVNGGLRLVLQRSTRE